MGFVFIMIAPLLRSHCGFFFVFQCRISFFGRFQHFLVNGCSAVSCDFGVFIKSSELTSFSSTILSLPPMFNFLRKQQAVFHSSWMILHHNQPCTRVPISPILLHTLFSLICLCTFPALIWKAVILARLPTRGWSLLLLLLLSKLSLFLEMHLVSMCLLMASHRITPKLKISIQT